MNPIYTYLLVNIGCILVPFLFSFHPRLEFYKEWRFFLPPCLAVAAAFLGWDILFTHLGVWQFNHDYVVGLFLWGLPVEEYLFFICIPFASVFSYHAFVKLLPAQLSHRLVQQFYALLSAVLLLTALIHWNRIYTSTTFVLLPIVLVYFIWRRSSFLPAFFICYLFILIPFVISNGILTGSFLGRVVVQYNDNENLGIRLLTIPIEDIFYGKLLLLLDVAGFEYLRKRSSKKAALPTQA